MHVCPGLLSVLSACLALFESAQCRFLPVYFSCSACLALFTECALCMFGPVFILQICSYLLFMLSACLALFTERAQCMFGPVF